MRAEASRAAQSRKASGPAVRGFVEAHALQPEVVAVGVAVGRVEDAEGLGGEVLGGRHDVEHDGLVAGDRGQHVEHEVVAAVGQEGVVPGPTTYLLAMRLTSAKSITMPLTGTPSALMMSPDSVTSSA